MPLQYNNEMSSVDDDIATLHVAEPVQTDEFNASDANTAGRFQGRGISWDAQREMYNDLMVHEINFV